MTLPASAVPSRAFAGVPGIASTLLACLCLCLLSPPAAMGEMATDGLRLSVMPDFASAVASLAPISVVPADNSWYVAPLTARNALLVIHLIGLSVGFGSALVLDAWILRWMVQGRVPPEIGSLFHVLGGAVVAGLALLWISGLGFLILYAATDPAKLANAKLYGKIGIVCVLTLNGVALHRAILPMTLTDLSRPMFSDLAPRARRAALVCGSLSGASWVAAFLLGILRELNGRIAFWEVMALWCALVLCAFALASLLMGGAARHWARVPAAPAVA
ncbi:hypothetical protein [Antarcticirhabdus aurantiaca]|uniref:Uncharacterized protein n=1 Tax=Antarcticirhabdus aurantiaca TaxID=2606717 RepID=A0ACD4NLX4_9HYPH|nr:hypothetical protein [Antarcticirhabdus aurantiaca]WAJ27839.1 hypothetical protein OXU80_23830 [Jeongeuplla avenae]